MKVGMSQDAALFNPLSSPHWHRVAHLRPQLARHVRIVRQWVRGQRWYVLQNAQSGQSCRLNASAYEVAARLDGQRDLHGVWALLDARVHQAVHDPAHIEPPTQDEVLQIVTQLQQHRMLNFDATADFGTAPGPGHIDAAIDADGSPTAPQQDTRRNTLLAWRIPLINPQPWLERSGHLAERLFSRTGLWLWCLLMLAMAGTLIVQAEALQAHAVQWMATPRYLLLATLCYPLIKAWHEAAHALAVHRWGGQVREAGLTLMMLMPVPYVDASAAHGFSQARHRVVVSAAGIMAELSLAALGLWCWVASEPGWLRDLGFVLWFAGGLSTLLFNANPLQRLDGYHMLTDACQLPNLAPRSQQWWQGKLRQWLRAEPMQSGQDPHAISPAAGEGPWLWLYAPLSWLYQLMVWFGMSWWLGSVAPQLAWAGMAATVWMSLCRPAWHAAREIWQSWLWVAEHEHGRRLRVARRALVLLSLPLLMLLPWPDRVMVQGLVWPPEEALVRPSVDGFVQAVHLADGAQVHAGDLILTLRNPKLEAQRAQVQARLAQAEQGSFGFSGADIARAGQAGDEVVRWQAELARLDEQLAALTVRARHDGRLVLPHAADFDGHYVHRGDVLGHVLDDRPPTIRVAVAETEVARLQAAPREVTVKLSSPDAPAMVAHRLRDSIAATRQLPSAALSQDMGGQVLTDPKDEQHLRALHPVVLMDVQLPQAPEGEPIARIGERAWVRVDQGWTPPVLQAWRWVSRQALADFSSSDIH